MLSIYCRLTATCAVLAVAVVDVTSAHATDGYFSNGFGARHRALAGSGVADGRDATTASLNPAGLTNLKRDEFTFSATAFSPHRKYEQTGFTRSAPFAGPGETESSKNFFPIPNMAYAQRTPGNPLFDAFAVTLYGNGGMNTSYEASDTPNGSAVFNPSSAARTGVNLEQAFLSVAFAKQFGNVSVGVAPILARQQFRAVGLDGFGVPDGGNDVSWGYGVRGGLDWSVAPNIRIGIAGNSRIMMQKFDRYANLFAEQGDFDIPPSLQAGVAIDVTPGLTLMIDYKRIWYSTVKSIANPSANFLTNGLGGDNGAGFGWDDVDVIKVGLEWDATSALTMRFGYSYNTQPIGSEDVTINILAPGVVQHHFTAGAELALDNNWSLELQGMFAPETSVKGDHLFNGANPCFPPPQPGFPCAGTEEISMYQYEVTAGVKYKF